MDTQPVSICTCNSSNKVNDDSDKSSCLAYTGNTVYNTFLNGLLPLFHPDLTYPHHHLLFGIHLVWPFSFLPVPICNYSKSTLQQIFRYDLVPEATSNCQKMLVSLFQ